MEVFFAILSLSSLNIIPGSTSHGGTFGIGVKKCRTAAAQLPGGTPGVRGQPKPARSAVVRVHTACTPRAQENDKHPETTRTNGHSKSLHSKGFRRFFKNGWTPCSSLIRMRSLVQIQVGPRTKPLVQQGVSVIQLREWWPQDPPVCTCASRRCGAEYHGADRPQRGRPVLAPESVRSGHGGGRAHVPYVRKRWRRSTASPLVIAATSSLESPTRVTS